MSLKVTPGRLKEVIRIKGVPDDTDDYGNPLPLTTLFTTRGDVNVRSGDQLASYGSVITSEVITVLMYQDKRITNDLLLEWNGLDYEILHIKPYPAERSMIVTAEIRTNGDNN